MRATLETADRIVFLRQSRLRSDGGAEGRRERRRRRRTLKKKIEHTPLGNVAVRNARRAAFHSLRTLYRLVYQIIFIFTILSLSLSLFLVVFFSLSLPTTATRPPPPPPPPLSRFSTAHAFDISTRDLGRRHHRQTGATAYDDVVVAAAEGGPAVVWPVAFVLPLRSRVAARAVGRREGVTRRPDYSGFFFFFVMLFSDRTRVNPVCRVCRTLASAATQQLPPFVSSPPCCCCCRCCWLLAADVVAGCCRLLPFAAVVALVVARSGLPFFRRRRCVPF